MMQQQRWHTFPAALAMAALLAACGGGSEKSPTQSAAPAVAAALTQEPGAPALTNNSAVDGLNWINYRRSQMGMPALARNTLLDRAAQGHTDYQQVNNKVTHDQIRGNPGFTGVFLQERMAQAGYVIAPNEYAYGEVISATSNSSGFYMTEELITAIYHRFVIFEPKFKEIGTGYAINGSGYSYLTANFAANNGLGAGLGRGKLATWPFNGQTKVTPNFYSDYEEPDPVPTANEVGYPVSVHADLRTVLAINTFSIRARGAASDLPVKLLKSSTDSHTDTSVAAIIPLTPLQTNTTYDVLFSGTADDMAVSKSWSFTTK